MTATAMPERTEGTRFAAIAGGRIAYEEIGHGPLVVLSPGMADIASTYRFLAPLIAAAGYRVASVDLRGHGEPSTGWPSYTHQDTADDLVAMIDELGGPAVVIGQSFSGVAAAPISSRGSHFVEASRRGRTDRGRHPGARLGPRSSVRLRNSRR